ncbi:hypothetical protein FD727_01770 [Pantoea sp. Mhis]|nr:hypothetical protein [Pantoea sp. Mhis]
MNDKYKNKKYIKQLIHQVQQQRLDLSSECNSWLRSTEKYDNYWMIISNIRRYLAIYSSTIAIWSIRSSSRIIRWVKFIVSLWNSWRMIKLTLSLQ